eukprot:g1499.t1
MAAPVPLRTGVSLAPTDPQSRSKQKKWETWLAEHGDVGPHVATLEKARVIGFRLRDVNRERMCLVYRRIDEEMLHVRNKAAPLRHITGAAGVDVYWKAVVALLCGTGIRPVAASHLAPTITPIALKSSGFLVGYKLSVLHDKAHRVAARSVYLLCTCEGGCSSMCPVHTLGVPPLPLPRDHIDAALAYFGSGSKTYATRRAHCIAVAHSHDKASSLAHLLKEPGFAARLTSQLNWTPDSRMFLEYANEWEEFPFTCVEEQMFFRPYYILTADHEPVPAASSGDPILPDDEMKFLQEYLDTAPSTTKTKRAAALKRIRAEGAACAKASAEIWRGRENAKISGHINTDCMRLLIKRHDYPDKSLPDEIESGFDLIGNTPRTGVMEPNPAASHLGAECFSEHISTVIKTTQRPSWMGEREISEAWKAAEEEVAKGWLEEVDPKELEKVAAEQQVFANYSFAVDQSTEEKEKFRAVVHFKQANLLSHLSEKIKLPSHRKYLAWFGFLLSGGVDMSKLLVSKKEIFRAMEQAREAAAAGRGEGGDTLPADACPPPDSVEARCFADWFHEVCSGVQPGANEDQAPATASPKSNKRAKRGKKVAGTKRRVPKTKVRGLTILARDFRSAYKQLSVKNKWHSVVGVFDPSSGRWRYFLAKCMALGSLWAIMSWVRVSIFVQTMLMQEAGVYTSVYIDDLAGCELDELAPQAGVVIDDFIAATGLRQSPEKSEAGKEVRLLGVEYSVIGHGVATNLRPQRREKIQKSLLKAVGLARSGQLSLKLVQQLAGKLNFFLIATKFSSISAALTPLYEAVSGLGPGDPISPEVQEELVSTLFHLGNIVLTAPPFFLDCRPEVHAPVSLWTDASESADDTKLCFVLRADDVFYTGSMCVPERMLSELRRRRKKLINILELLGIIWALEVCGPRIRGRRKLHAVMLSGGVMWSVDYIPSADNPSDGGTRDALFPAFFASLAATGKKAQLLEFGVTPALDDVHAAICRAVPATRCAE